MRRSRKPPVEPPASLVEALSRAGMSKSALARELGVSPPAVSQWVGGATTPTGPARRLIAQLMGVPLAVVESWFKSAPSGA
jgi:DNA-binding transcriptional regulator YiaG